MNYLIHGALGNGEDGPICRLEPEPQDGIILVGIKTASRLDLITCIPCHGKLNSFLLRVYAARDALKEKP